MVLISLSIFSLWTRNELAKFTREPIEQEIIKWEQLVLVTPTYRDGYLKLATLYWRLDEDEKAKEMLTRAKGIDPNYEETEKLKKDLGY